MRCTDDHPSPTPSFGAFLVRRGRLTGEALDDLTAALAADPRRPALRDLLVERGLLDEVVCTAELAEYATVPFVRLGAAAVPAETAAVLPAEFLERHNLLPISITDDIVVIAADRFTDVMLRDELARRCGRAVSCVAAPPAEIREARRRALPHAASNGPSAPVGAPASAARPPDDDLEVVQARSVEDDQDLAATAAQSPVIALVNHLIRSAVEAGASDIHIEPEEGSFRVRCRIDGDLRTMVRPSGRMLPAVVSRIKVLAGLDISERRHPQDGGVTVRLHGRSVDIRISTMATKFGEKVVMRIADRERAMPTLADIGMRPAMLDRFRSVLGQPNGIILITGPTGSGKSTTLYAALAELVGDPANISTIEDPIERIIPGANQFQVSPRTGHTFATALRSMLRQDPDVIMVGEVRDAETAKLATEAAMTGHLILSTLHTNDAPSSVPRLINMGVEPYLVAASLRGVVAQRLVRRLCPACAEARTIPTDLRAALSALGGSAAALDRSCAASGCPTCSDSGSRGRIAVFDLLLLDESTLARMAADHLAGRTPAPRTGGLLEDGLAKVRDGLIAAESLLRIMPRALHDPRDAASGAAPAEGTP